MIFQTIRMLLINLTYFDPNKAGLFEAGFSGGESI